MKSTLLSNNQDSVSIFSMDTKREIEAVINQRLPVIKNQTDTVSQ